MDRSNHKRSKRRLILCDSDSSSGSDEVKQLKYRKPLQSIIPTRNITSNKINILENVQVCPPSTAKSKLEIDSDSENDFFSSSKKFFVSPSTGKQYSVLESKKVQNPEVSCNPILLTPTQKFKRDNYYNQSRASSPDLNIFGETSRCSSLSNISYSNLLPVQLSEENMQDLLQTTSSSYTKSEKQKLKNKNYIFIHSFEGENTEGDNIIADLHKKNINIKKCTVEKLTEQKEEQQKFQHESNLQQHQEQDQKEQKNQHQDHEEKHQEQNVIYKKKEKKYQEQDGEHLQQEEEHQQQKDERQGQDEVHSELEEQQVRRVYAEQQADNDTENENIISTSSNDHEEDENTDISIESSESNDEVDDNETSENEDELDGDNQIAEPESIDNEDSWVDICDDDRIDFDENTLDSTIIPCLRNKTPMEIYSLFLTDEIINKIVQHTNKYAERYFEDNKDNIKDKSRLKAWKPTDNEEMRTFFGVILVMGLNTVPKINDYWSKKTIYRNDYICSIMPRDRFLIILNFWHFCDELTDNNGDKLYKIRQIVDTLNSRFQQVLHPGKVLVIDETMIPWRGRLKFRQYIKNKSHKYGVKLYKLCTPEGYSYNTVIYAGKEGNNKEQDHGKKTVLRLIRGLENEGRIVVADNFYSSVGLAEELLARKTFYCGTLRSNRRGLPKKVISKKLKKNQTTGKMNLNGVKIIKWCDKRQVLMITTCKGHNAVLVNTGKKARVTNEDIKKPSCVLLYNENKKGIDYSDQMSSYYTTLKRGIKWYRKVMAEFLFGTSLVNAWILYNMSCTNKKMSKKDFTESIIEALTGQGISERVFPSGRCADHLLQKGGQRKRCVGCYEKLRLTLNSTQAAKKTKKIITFCVQCKKSFCLPCFNEKHFN